MRRNRGWSPFKTLLIVLGAIWGLGVLTGTFLASRPAPPVPQTAPLVREIQQLGQLHTVRYNVHDVVRHDHTVQPPNWVRSLPGASSLYEAVTGNSVLVTAEGGVEAGVDLSQVTLADVSRVLTPDGVRLRIRLPHASIYPPEVHVEVVDREAGLLWNDENIVPEATEEAGRRFREAASRSGILAAAEANAVQRLNAIQKLDGTSNVDFYF